MLSTFYTYSFYFLSWHTNLYDGRDLFIIILKSVLQRDTPANYYIMCLTLARDIIIGILGYLRYNHDRCSHKMSTANILSIRSHSSKQQGISNKNSDTSPPMTYSHHSKRRRTHMIQHPSLSRFLAHTGLVLTNIA